MVGAVFTGLIEAQGSIAAIAPRAGTGRTLRIACDLSDLAMGESIAVDGACLTVTRFEPGSFACDVSEETCLRTRAADYSVGQSVHLERALKVGDRLGGHWVMGHVDGTLAVKELQEMGDCRELIFHGVDPSSRPYLVEKGSVAIDGVSLTVNTVAQAEFSVCIVPHTLRHTHLGQLKVGDRVNIEWDWMAKILVQAVKGQNYV